MKNPSKIQFNQAGGVARIVLNRPEVHNALDGEAIEELTRAFLDSAKNDEVRVIVLSGEGKNFCAGADVNWMKDSIRFTQKQNEADALKFHKMLVAIYACPKPTIAKVHGIAFGGGVGLISAVDVTVTTSDALMALSEVKLGILPAVISPFVARKIGVAAFRAYGLSAKRIRAEEALRIGLVQEVVPMESLDGAVNEWTNLFLQNGPKAMATAKELSDKIRPLSISAASKLTVKTIAKIRTSPEGQEGLKAFLEKRKPNWLS